MRIHDTLSFAVLLIVGACGESASRNDPRAGTGGTAGAAASAQAGGNAGKGATSAGAGGASAGFAGGRQGGRSGAGNPGADAGSGGTRNGDAGARNGDGGVQNGDAGASDGGADDAGTTSAGGTGGCRVISDTLDVDVRTVAISGSITVNGMPPVTEGLIRLVAGDDTAEIAMGSGTYSAEIIAGTYEIWATLDLGRAVPVPLGRTVAINKARTLDIDIPTVIVSGDLTVNGEPPSIASLYAYLSFRTSNGLEAAWASLYPGTYSVEVPQGTYSVLYSNTHADGNSPENQNTPIFDDVALDADRHLDIDIPMVTLSGDLGAWPTTAPTFYVTADDGGFALISDVDLGTYSVRLIPGSYDIRVGGGAGPSSQNDAEPLAHVELDESKTLTVDAPIVTISGAVTLNGAPAPDASGGTLYLVGGSNRNAQLASLSSSTYSATVIPGIYDIEYHGTVTATDYGYASNPNDGVPDNPSAVVLRGVEILTSRTLDIDVPMAVITGNIGVNGEPAEPGREGRLYFESPGGSLVAATTADVSYRAELMPGTYTVAYTRYGDATVNGISVRLFSDLQIDEDDTLDLDVPMRHLSGSTTVNGAPPPSNGFTMLWLVGANGYSDISGGWSVQPTYASEVIPGTYDIRFTNNTSGAGFPINHFAKLGCVRVP